MIKRKKLLVVTAIVSLIFSGFTAIGNAEEEKGCTHENMVCIEEEPATCISSGGSIWECQDCGAISVSSNVAVIGDHDYQLSSWVVRPHCGSEGTAVMVCSYCGAMDVRTTPRDYSEHSMDDYITTKEATCTSEGSRERKCINCEYKETEVTPYAAHNYGSWTTVTEATCTKEGLKKGTCTVCGKTSEESIARKSHDFDSWDNLTPVTDHSKGVQSHKCKVCAYEETKEILPEGTIEPGTKKKEIEVYVLQELLTEEHLLNDKVDGIYGKNTEKAICDFQKQEGFEETGIAYPQTILRLLENLLDRMGEETKKEIGSSITCSVKKEARITELLFEREGDQCSWKMEAIEEETEESKPVIETETSAESSKIKRVTKISS